MAAIHEASNETSTTVGDKRLRVAGPLARSSRPTARPIRHGELSQYADLCSGVLREARSLASAGSYGPALIALLTRASDLLDDIDEFLVASNPLQDAEAYRCAAELHRALEEIQAALPQHFRGRGTRASLLSPP